MKRVAGAWAVVLLAGCVEDLKAVRLLPDGSGTLTYTRRMRTWAVDLARQNKAVDEFTEEKARERAAGFGDGVRFVSAEKLEAEGWKGLKAVYAFQDVEKLRLDASTSFRLEKQPGGTLLLTASFPFQAPKKDSGEEALKLSEEEKRAMLSGLKLGLSVEVKGKVLKCSSPYVEGSTLTLLEFDLDSLLAEEARLKKLAAAEPRTLEEAKEILEALRRLLALQGGAPDLEAYRQALRGIQGVKHALAPQVTLEFAP